MGCWGTGIFGSAISFWLSWVRGKHCPALYQVGDGKMPLAKSGQTPRLARLDSEEGQEYWLAMNLAGDYASACHHNIHKRLAKALGEQPIAMV